MKLKSLVGLPRDLRALYGGVAGLLTPPHKRLFCLTALWAAGFSLLELLLAAAVLPYFDCLNGAGCGVVGSGAERLSLHPLLLFSLLLILLLSIKTGAEVLLTWSLTGFHQSVQRDLVLRLLAAFLHQSWPAFRERHRADYFKRCAVTAVDAAYACQQSLSMLAWALVVLVLAALLLWVNPWVSLGLLLIFLSVGLLTQRAAGRLQERAGQAREQALHGWHLGMAEALASFRELRVQGAEDHFLSAIAVDTGRLAGANRRLAFLPLLPRLALDYLGLSLVLLVVLLWLALERPLADLLPYFVFYAVVARSVLPALIQLVGARLALQGMVINLELVQADLAAAEARRSPRPGLPLLPSTAAVASPQAPPNGRADGAGVDDGLIVADVSFAYPGRPAPVLQEVSARMGRGQWTALVGPSGSGKSTLMELLCGIQTPDSGRLGWRPGAGEPARPPVIAYVPQQVALLDASLFDNVVFGHDPGRPQAVQAALETAQLLPLLRSLPGGAQARVGAEGLSLSGGERQRLAIARALYRQPDLLLLDEATAGLDETVELALLTALRRALPRATVVFITHRKAGLRCADQVLRLRAARLEAQRA